MPRRRPASRLLDAPRTPIGRRHDLVLTSELTAAGLDHHQIADLVADGLLTRLARGIYAVGRAPSRERIAAAATLLHNGGIVTGRSGGALHGLEVDHPPRPEIVIPPGGATRSSLASLLVSPVPPEHRTRVRTIPVTTVARTIVDIGMTFKPSRLASVLDAAITEARTTPNLLASTLEAVERAAGRQGTGRLRDALAPWLLELCPDSPAEMRLLRLLLEHGAPMPVTQFRVDDPDGSFVALLDVAWPEHRVGLEYDSPRWHGPRRWEDNEERIAQLARRDWDVKRVGVRHLDAHRLGWMVDLVDALRRAA